MCCRVIDRSFFSVSVISCLLMMSLATFDLAQEDRGLRRSSSNSSASERLALVIGNQNYETALNQNVLNDGDIVPDSLNNPLNDAGEIAKVLSNDLGFSDVKLLTDANGSQMQAAIREFGEKLRRNPTATALFFYAGHAVQVNGLNYLIPLGVAFKDVSEVDEKAIGLRSVFDEIGNRETGVSLVLLDACRDNPFKDRSVGASNGLAAPSASLTGMFVAYAAKAGQKAKDGPKHGHSHFTQALLNIVHSCDVKGLSLITLFGRVTDEVIKRTGGKQTPAIYSEVGGYVLIPQIAPKLVVTPCTNTTDHHQFHCMPDDQRGILVVVSSKQQIKVNGRFDADNENCIQIYRRRDGKMVAVWNNFEINSGEWESERNESCDDEVFMIVSRHKDSGPDAAKPWLISSGRILSGSQEQGRMTIGFEDGGDNDFNDSEVTIRWARQ